MRVDYDVPVPVRDGVALSTDLHRPEGDGPWPCLLQRVPYDKGVPGVLNGALDVAKAVRRGYVVATQDCRGRFASEGEFTPFLQEADDGEDTIAWLRAQPWSDGSVGMFGRSYSGILQWWTAARRVEGLRAIAPALSGPDPVADWFGGDGPLEWGFVVLWSVRHLAPDLLGRQGWPVEAADLLDSVDDVGTLLLERPGDGRLHRLARSLPFLAEWLRGEPGALGALAAAAPDDGGSVPALVIAGWFDVFLAGCLRAFAARDDGSSSLIVGPWAHGGTLPGVFPERSFGVRSSADASGLTERQLDWFDRWLRPDAGGVNRDRVTWFHMGEDTWRSGPSFPPPSARPVVLALSSRPDGPGQLGPAPSARHATRLRFDEDDPVPTLGGGTFLPGLEVAANAGPRDQQELVARQDVAVFLSEPLEAPLDVIGPVACRIRLRTALAGTSLVVRLVEVRHDGTMPLVADGAARGGGPDGEDVHVALGGTSWRFAPGTRIGLLLSCTSAPRYRRWVTAAVPAEPRSGSVEVVHDRNAGSVLELLVEQA
jgi:putative CocE/NonD family hydrolase